MLKKLVSFALNQPLFMILLLVLFIGGGAYSFKTLSIEAFPDVTDVQVPIITLYPGQAAEEVEKQVTIPLEIALAGVPHSIRTFSHTQFGLSFIYITFDDEVDHYFARQQIIERMQTAELPDGIKPELGPLTSPVGEIYRIELKGGGYSAVDLRSMMDWTVVRQLKMVPGVADVVGRGGYVKQYQVIPNLTALKSRKLPVKQLFAALEKGNANAGGGFIEQGSQQFIIRGVGLLKTVSDIQNVVVSESNGVPVLVRDVATVSTGFLQRQGLVGRDDVDDIVTGIILMRKGENSSVVLQAVKERMVAVNSTMLPKGVTVEPYYDRAWLIDRTLKTVFSNLTEGAILVAIILYLFLGNLRSAGIVAIIIPLSLLATFVGLKLRGIPANLLSLGAMDFGIIVDGAVIVIENIFRNLSEHRPEPRDLKRAVQDATLQVGRPTFFSMLIIIIAHLPIFTLQRHEGRIFAPMAYTVVSALIGSLLFSLTLVPLLSYFLLGKNLSEKDNFIVRLSKRLYRPVLVAALNHKAIVITLAMAALIGSIFIVPQLGSEFLPELNEGTIWVNFTLPPGISISEVNSKLRQVRKTLKGFKEVRSVVSQAGRPEDGTDPKPINMVEVFVDVYAPETWTRKVTKDDLILEMERALEVIPGVVPTFTQPIRDQVLESISQIDGQIVIKMYGEEVSVLSENIKGLLREVAKVPGVARAFVDRAGSVPQLMIEIDRARASRYGLNVDDVDDMIEIALGGKPATYIWEGEKKFSVAVRLSEDERSNVDTLRGLLIDTPGGSHVPLEQVANIEVREGSMNISRESGLRVQSVGVFIRGRDMGSIVKDMQRNVERGDSFAHRLLHHLGRRVRKSGTSNGPLIGDCSGERGADLHPPF